MLLNRNILLKGIGLPLLAVAMLSCSHEDIYDPNGGNGDKTQLFEQSPLVTLHISPVSKSSSSPTEPQERIKYLRIVMLNEDKIEFNKLVAFLPEGGAMELPGAEEGDLIDPEEPEDNGSSEPGVSDGNDNENNQTEGKEEEGDGEDNEKEEDGPVIEPSGPFGQEASSFQYTYTFPASVGNKSFFLIGNEQSVSKVKFQLPEDFDLEASGYDGLKELKKLSEEGDGISLYYVLNYYTKLLYKYTDKAGEFSMVMNSLYFEPDYSVDENNNVYLPYTAFYSGKEIKAIYTEEEEEQPAIQDLGEMFLVPCATKFRFIFNNYRPDEVEVNKIGIEGVAKNLYLNGQVREKEQKKKLPSFISTQEYYWIDWLAETSKNSWSYESPGDNEGFNQIWGWISHYDVPNSAYPEEVQDSPDKDGQNDNESQIIPEIIFVEEQFTGIKNIEPYKESDEGDELPGYPGILEIGPFYAPESKWNEKEEVTAVDGKDVKTGNYIQSYILNLVLSGKGAGTTEAKENNEFHLQIGKLNTLFRNTYVRIIITMRDQFDVGAYAQIEPWKEHNMNGYLQEEE